MTDGTARYGSVAIALHWTSAALVVAGFALGLWMTGLDLSPATLRYYAWHKWIGVTVFVTAAARLAWRVAVPPPPWPDRVPPWQRRAAAAVHRLLYVLLLAVPVSGWLYGSASGVQVVYLGVLPLPNPIGKDREGARWLLLLHQTLNFTLAAAVTVHVAAAWWHGVVLRDGVPARMLPRRR